MPDEPEVPDNTHDSAKPDPTDKPDSTAEPDPTTPGPTAPPDTGYDSSGVPTFDYVREKIEQRYGTALGANELDAETSEGRRIEEQYEERQREAAERLAEIRKSMRPGEKGTE